MQKTHRIQDRAIRQLHANRLCRRTCILLQAILLSHCAAAAWQTETKPTTPAVEHKTKFDSEMVPGVRAQEVIFSLSNSRQIVRTAAGQWLLAFEVPHKGLFLTSGPPGCEEGSQFQRPILIVGDGTAGVLATGSNPVGASIAVAGGFLYIAWSDAKGVWATKAALAQAVGQESLKNMLRAAPPAELIAREGVLGDIAMSNNGRPAVAYSINTKVFVAINSGSRWIPEKVADSGSEPVIEYDGSERLHLAYRNRRETPFFGHLAFDPKISYTVREAQGWKSPQIVAQGLSFHPSLAVAVDTPVIAFQYEGLKHLQNVEQNYLDQREGSGASIGYAAADNDGFWKTGFVSQAHEIRVREGSVANDNVGRVYPLAEQKWRPRIAVDKYGIPWAFWPDTTRRHTYFARWLGSGFSDPYECRGAYYAPSEYMAVEKHMPLNSSDIGFAYAAAGRLYFGTVPVPSASTAETRHFLFLDMLDVSQIEGIKQHLNQFKKYDGNPVFKPAAPGNWDDYGLSFPNVRFDRGKFTMEYSGHGAGGTAGAWNHGYAESLDGIHWTRPKLGLIEHDGSRNNNLIPWVANFLDREEPDPNKRYKGVLIEGNWITNFERRLEYSPDALHWRPSEETTNLTSMLEGGGPSFRDELDIPERRFKSIGRTISQGHRALGMLWSSDLIHWYGDEAILDVTDPYGKPAEQWRGRYVARRILDPSGDKAGDQIYWGTVWIENGIYLCLYAPFQYDGGYQAALAMSRDGLHYVRIRNGDLILPRGPAGAWDSGFIAVGYGFNVPLKVGNKIRVYYGGVTSHHGTDPWRASVAIGMAELPIDGWTFLSPTLYAPQSYVTTIPFTVSPGQPRHVYVRGDVPGGRGKLEVEILDEHDHVLPGYSRRDCHSLSSVFGEAMISWNGSDVIKTQAKRLRLRFYLTGPETRLYSFWFR